MLRALISTVVVLLAFVVTGWAQPTFTLPVQKQNQGDRFCMEVTVEDFTDICTVRFWMKWNPNVLKFEGVEGFNLNNLSTGNFDLSAINDGVLGLNWDFPTPNQGVTLADGQAIFRICFTAIGGYGASSTVAITDNPTTGEKVYVTRLNAKPANIGLFNNDGYITTGVEPIYVSIDSAVGNEGDLVCLDVKVKNFQNIVSMQFSINWTAEVLEFSHVTGFNLPALDDFAFGRPGEGAGVIKEGQLTVTWYRNGLPTSVADGTAIFQVCLKIKGKCGQKSKVQVTGNPLGIEFTNGVVDGASIGVYRESGEVTVGNCSGGLQLESLCGTANPGETICVPVRVRDFKQITETKFSFNFNPTILKYKSVRVNASSIGLRQDQFDLSNAGTGVISLNWRSALAQGFTLPDNTILFDICFDVIGTGGFNSPVSFSNATIKSSQTGNQNIGIVASNCEVTVLKPEGLTLNISSATVNPNSAVCVDVTVDNFQQINSMQFSLAWDDAILEFDTLIPVNLPDFSEANYAVVPGGIQLSWDPSPATHPNGVDLADGETAFQLCYNVIGAVGSVSPVFITDVPLDIVVTATNSNGNPINFTKEDGEVRVLSEDGFTIFSEDITGNPGEVICLPFAAKNFSQLGKVQFSINWDAKKLELIEVQNSNNLPGVSDNSFVINPLGFLTFQWTGNNMLDDGTELFSLCFKLIGSGGSCNPVKISGSPMPIEVLPAGGGMNLGLNNLDGNICINNVLVWADTTITNVGCQDNNSGSILVNVLGGSPPYNFQWDNGRATPNLIGLSAGRYTITVTDQTQPPLRLEATFEVKDVGEAPSVDVGNDVTIPCSEDQALLGAQVTGGNSLEYQWTTLGGNFLTLSDRKDVSVGAPGIYILTVSDKSTGCTVTDTLNVFTAPKPEVNAGLDRQITCDNTSADLDASRSDIQAGDNISWRAIRGGSIVSGGDTPKPTVDAGGFYIFEINRGGCIQTDTVEVKASLEVPLANAGTDIQMSCQDTVARLDGSQSNTGSLLTYRWITPSGSILGGIQTNSKSLGTYVLEVVNNQNGCIGRDTIAVLPAPDRPMADAGRDSALTCLADVLQLSGKGSGGVDFAYEWTTDSGRILSGGNTLNPSVDLPGQYQLKVTNKTNGCASTAQVSIRDGREEIVAEAGEQLQLQCGQEGLEISGSTTSETEGLEYEWTASQGVEAIQSGQGTLNITVNSHGLYYLTIRNPLTGCVAIDSVEVVAPLNVPVAKIANPATDQLCSVSTVQLDASASNQGQGFIYEWSVVDGIGVIISGNGSLKPEVSNPGQYRLIVTGPDGCKSSPAQISLQPSSPDLSASAGSDLDLDCGQESAQLDGSASGGASNLEYQWSILQGNGTLQNESTAQPTITAPGQYLLIVKDPGTGCTSRDTIAVGRKTDPDMVAQAVAEVILECNESEIALDASGSSTGDQYEYQWQTTGGLIVSGGASLNPVVSEAGDYTLIVTNTENQCTAEAIVKVTDRADLLEQAQVGPDQTQCGKETPLTANLPQGSSGQWTTLEGAVVLAPDANATEARSLADGMNTFIWTLSTETCPSYSVDTVYVMVQTRPDATDDQLTVDRRSQNTVLAVTANDDLGGAGAFSLSVLSNPDYGKLTLEDAGKVLKFNASGANVPQLGFTYEVCSQACPTLCDTAFVQLLLRSSDSLSLLPNAITPNGDGLNDALVFDVLFDDPDLSQQSELTIFNRWGDIVFQQHPYNNDWNGINDLGQNLPQGTYYFILRVSVGEGKILKGDVTVLR